MKRSILFSLIILILLAPLVATTENDTSIGGVETSVPTPTVEEPIIIENGENNTSLETLEEPLVSSVELAPSKEVVIIPAGNTTVSGATGYVVLPSAELAPSENGTSITTGYSGIFSTDVYAHVPFVQLGFSDIAEVSLAVDRDVKTDLLLNAKWRFSHRKGTSLAVGMVGQLIDVGATNDLAAQLYFASTFSSSIMDFPSKTTVLLGYTFHKNLNTNIDFGLAFQTPFFPSAFKEKVYVLLDFGNVSYSVSPSAGEAEDRGLVNVGLRLVPIKVLKSVYLSADIRALDLFDHEGRALSLGVTLAFRPD
jgi:hypothetical protein